MGRARTYSSAPVPHPPTMGAVEFFSLCPFLRFDEHTPNAGGPAADLTSALTEEGKLQLDRMQLSDPRAY